MKSGEKIPITFFSTTASASAGVASAVAANSIAAIPHITIAVDVSYGVKKILNWICILFFNYYLS
ncbi:hypothetical protein [Pelagibaculum spongiae]|nr:hypothetical protein [Pelagibaculum spongiae]